MKLIPKEVALLAELQKEFDNRYKGVLSSAYEIYTERAPLYDVTTPVWHRVAWPEGYLHEDSKKLGRIVNTFAAGVDATNWPKVREEMLDKINYMAFAVAFGDMLFEALPLATQSSPTTSP